MQPKYVGNKHRHVWLSSNPDPEFSLASRPARSLGWQVRLVGWLLGLLFICLAGLVAWLVCCLADRLAGEWFGWLLG